MKNAYFENFYNQYKITKYLIKDIDGDGYGEMI